MSDTSALARRRAFWFGSFARNGLIGLRCTTAGGGVGVDGVENAADTLPLAVNAGDGVAGFGGAGSGIAPRDGGVSGAPKGALNIGVEPVSGFGPAAPDGAAFGIDPE
jgi:hypothetical protein